MSELIWFRKDLRLADNPALHHACLGGRPPLALFVSTPTQWRSHQMAPMQADLLERALNDLAGQLAEKGIILQRLQLDSFDQVPLALARFCQRHDVQRIHAAEEPELNERRRDQAVVDAGLPLSLYPGHCILPPGSVVKEDGSPYRVFTPFRRAWLAKLRQQLPLPLPEPGGWTAVAAPPPVRLDYPKVSSTRWPVGREVPRRRLERFTRERMAHYHQLRDRPDLDGTSVLSPYLALGMLSPLTCLHGALALAPEALEEQPGGAFSWINELAWRDFYRHLLVRWPNLSKGKNFNPLGNKIVWETGWDTFDAWCQGRTGYPLVDAAMRQLSQCGWMHNRLRMVTASFLTKNLLIDWRRGERWFSSKLADGDLAANNGGWQWSAGTGCDAQPYFRIFNPINQSKKFDPNGDFIRTYVPELKHLSNKAIHLPPESMRPGSYPAPIVDLSQSRRRALERFAVMKREDV